jgi:hypothetical protein
MANTTNTCVATVPLSETQAVGWSPPGSGRGLGRVHDQPASSSVKPSTTLAKPRLRTKHIASLPTIPTRSTDQPSSLETPANDSGSTNGGVKPQPSTSVGDLFSTTPNMAPTGSTQKPSQGDSDASSNRTLVITLSTVLSVVAFLIVFGSIFVCYRFRRGRLAVFKRGISPIDDEEIESWKANRGDEKYTSLNRNERHDSAASVKKPPSVIVYQNPAVARASGEHSPRFSAGHSHHHSIDVPQTPVLARAPNSRPGLTDETVEGDDAYVPPPRRHPSRLSKLPSPRHARTRSSRSSLSVGSCQAWPGSPNSPRASNEYSHYYPRTSHSYDRKHARIYSNSSIPPRLSFDDDFFVGGLSPRPLIRRSDFTPESEIGRAIG